MATNTQATQARALPWEAVHYLRKDFTFADNGKVLHVGILPAGAVMIKSISGVSVNVAFNAGTSNVLDIGIPTNDDLYATDLALGAIAFVALDEAVSMAVAADTEIIATPALTGTDATAGQGTVIIAYTLPDK